MPSGRHGAGRKELGIPVLRRLARTLIAVPIAAVALSACVPSAPAPTISCDGINGTYSLVLEWCHTRYHSYKLDGSSPAAQNLADYLAATMTSCSNLGTKHSTSAQLRAAYPSATSIAENLFCWSGGACPTAQAGAASAMNAWVRSSGHRQNLDSFAGQWVNAAAQCNSTRHIYFGVAQFHKP